MAYSEYAMENINIEESKILVQDKWYALNELKNTIKEKVNNDNFDVIQLASSIQELQEALDNITQLKLTLHVELMESFKEIATNSESTFENVLRDALITRIDFGLTKNMSKIPGKPKGEPKKKAEKKSTIKIKRQGYKPKKVACRKCKSVIVVDSPKRPITVTCPECGTKGKLSK
jgi:hypothetical protein